MGVATLDVPRGTASEGYLVQFADGKTRMSDGDEVKYALRSEVVSEVPSDMVAFHTSTNSVTDFWARSASGFVSIPALRGGCASQVDFSAD